MQYSFTELEKIAEYAEQSGLFGGGQKLTKAHAMMRLLRGVELNLPPMTALGGLWLSRGKLIVDAATTAVLLNQNGYEVRDTESTNERCIMALYRDGAPIGNPVAFTIEDAKTAGLVRPDGNWKSYPADMLWARCLTRLARRYAAHVFGGAVYNPGEIEDEQPQIETSPTVPQLMGTTDSAAVRTQATKDQADALAQLKALAVTKLGCESSAVRKALLEWAGMQRLGDISATHIARFTTERYEGPASLVDLLIERAPEELDLYRERYGCYGNIPWEELCELAQKHDTAVTTAVREAGDIATAELFGDPDQGNIPF